MADNNPYQPPQVNTPIRPENAADGKRPTALGTLANLTVLAVMAAIGLKVFFAVCGIIYHLALPCYYQYVKGSMVETAPGYYYRSAVQPGVVVLILVAVAWGLGRVRGIIKRRFVKCTNHN
jgi:hypothetical protein